MGKHEHHYVVVVVQVYLINAKRIDHSRISSSLFPTIFVVVVNKINDNEIIIIIMKLI